MAIVAFQNVCKDYLTDGQRVHALDDVSLEVNRGEFVALVGRSGCGKSTLLNLAGAMDFPTSGRVLLEGVETSTLKDAGLTCLRRDKVGFIFQSFQLLHTLTVFENVELPLLLAGKPNARSTAKEWLAWVELDGLGDRYPHQLSGGQMQRVGIARALVQSPAILLADEPTGNLDSKNSDIVLKMLRQSNQELGQTVLMITHNPEAARYGDRIIHMRDGEIVRPEDDPQWVAH